MWSTSRRRRFAQEATLAALLVALTPAPILNIVWIVATTGASTPSNDFVAWAPLVASILEGSNHWSNFFHDAFRDGHAEVFPTFVRILLARFFYWNTNDELYVAVGLGVLELVFLHHLLGRELGRPARLALWPALAALVFSTSQINMFTYGTVALHTAFGQLGTILGIWGLLVFPGWRGVLAMTLGGMVASLSTASGLAAWPVFLCGLASRPSSRPTTYAVWLGAMLVSALPYALNLAGVVTDRAPLDHRFLVGAIGLPFAPGLSPSRAYHVGWIGLGLLATATTLASGAGRSRATGPLLLVGLGLSTIVLLGIARADRGLASWYPTYSMAFWIGLVGLAVTSLDSRPLTRPRALLGWATCVVIAALYLTTNLSYRDKVFYLFSRTPASAAAVRHYLDAPTYAEGTVFQWGVGYPSLLDDMARPLDRIGLSVFGPSQHWTLQGDFVLATVEVTEHDGVPDVGWSRDLSDTRLPWSHYDHLNLLLHSPNSIAWTVTIPANARTAELRSALAISASAPVAPDADGLTGEVIVEGSGTRRTLYERHLGTAESGWHPFTVPLATYAGRTITLRFGSRPGANTLGDLAVFRHPEIRLRLDPARRAYVEETPRPANTDVSPLFPGRSDRDRVLDPSTWSPHAMTPAGPDGTWRLDGRGWLQAPDPLELPLDDYTHFYFEAAVPPGILPRASRIYFRLLGQSEFSESHAVSVPLVADGELHAYTYDLKLLELPRGARLSGLRFDPLERAPAVRGLAVRIAGFRLLRSVSLVGAAGAVRR